MMYDDNHDPEIGESGEIVGTWVFAIALVGVVLFVLGMMD